MPESGLTLRIRRFLYGEFRVDDLSEILLALRDLPYVGQCVAEVGNFTAHRLEREKGLVTQEARDFFETVRFAFDPANRQPDQDNMPPRIIEVIEANFRRIDEKNFRREFGPKKKAAKPILKSLVSKFSRRPDGRMSLDAVTDDEAKLVSLLASSITSRPAFTARQLSSDFSDALHRNNLIKPADQKAVEKKQDILSLYAMERMHLATIVLADGTRAYLRLGFDDNRRLLIAGNSLMTEPKPPNPITFSAPMFNTNLKVDECCEEALVACAVKEFTWNLATRSEEKNSGAWDCPIELTPRQKLARLVGPAELV